MRELFRESNYRPLVKDRVRLAEGYNSDGVKDFRQRLVSVFIGVSGKQDFRDNRWAGKDTGSNYDDPYSRRFVKGGLSYAEAVKEDDHRKTEVKKDLTEPERGITMT
ncbi:hypothetical protein Q3G72_026500 [Acer saccharum]|nr:hypothetical protein Q3G72_026500 [Acer saccharum]